MGKDVATILHMGKDGVTLLHMGKDGVAILLMGKICADNSSYGAHTTGSDILPVQRVN